MTSKTIYVMEGLYRNKRIENTTFPLVKGYQPYPHKQGGFVTVHIDDMAKYQAPADKIRISVESESQNETFSLSVVFCSSVEKVSSASKCSHMLLGLTGRKGGHGFERQCLFQFDILNEILR